MRVERRVLPLFSSPFTLHRLYRRLYRHFGPQRWWPAESGWEMMVGAILTQNTAWTNVEKALRSLKKASALDARSIAGMSLRRLEKLIYSAGFFRQKATRLRSFARLLHADRTLFKQLSGMEKGDLAALRVLLLSQNGIGPETADSMLLYAGQYPIFVVDAYTRRAGNRIGLFQSSGYDEIQRYFQDHFRSPPERTVERYNEFHALIVMLAKRFCTKRRPRCAACPAAPLCDYARKEKAP